MILYNVTLSVDVDIHDEWLYWMQQEHLPEVMATGCFESYRMHRIIGGDQGDSVSYAVGYVCKDMKTMHQYQVQYGPALQAKTASKYADKCLAFRTLMEIISEG